MRKNHWKEQFRVALIKLSSCKLCFFLSSNCNLGIAWNIVIFAFPSVNSTHRKICFVLIFCLKKKRERKKNSLRPSHLSETSFAKQSHFPFLPLPPWHFYPPVRARGPKWPDRKYLSCRRPLLHLRSRRRRLHLPTLRRLPKVLFRLRAPPLPNSATPEDDDGFSSLFSDIDSSIAFCKRASSSDYNPKRKQKIYIFFLEENKT